MAQKFYNENDIQAIASAIRAKNGLSSTYTVSQMASAIQNIPSGSEGNTDIEDSFVTRTLSRYENSRVTSVGSYAFAYCSTLTSVSFPQATIIEEGAFQNCDVLTSINFPQVSYIGISAFQSCSALTSVNFSQATNISRAAFYYCTALTEANFPQVTSIQNATWTTQNGNIFVDNWGPGAFHNCSSLVSISFPQLRHIGDSAFYKCTALTFASFPQITSIGSFAFSSCSALTSVILGGNQSKIGWLGYRCFKECHYLINLILSGNYSYQLDGSAVFYSTPILDYIREAGQYGSIYVPASLYSEYISATNWAYFSSRIVSF